MLLSWAGFLWTGLVGNPTGCVMALGPSLTSPSEFIPLLPVLVGCSCLAQRGVQRKEEETCGSKAAVHALGPTAQHWAGCEGPALVLP